MVPILDKIAIANPCPPLPNEEKKYWYSVIRPEPLGWPNFTNWTINGLDLITNVNFEMALVGGSGIVTKAGKYDLGNNLIVCWLACYANKSNLPNVQLSDPIGSVYNVNWIPLYYGPGEQYFQGWNEIPFGINVTFNMKNTLPKLNYLEFNFFSEFQWPISLGYTIPTPFYYIDLNAIYGGINVFSDPLASTKIQNILNGIFLNNVSVNINFPNVSTAQINIENVYCISSGHNDNNWKHSEIY